MIMKDCISEDIKLYFNTKTLFIMLPNPVIMRTRSPPSPYTNRVQ
jgi:hypothetical protein